MDGVVHSSFPRAFWLGVAVATRGRDYSAPISLPTTDTRRCISAIDVLGVTLVYANVRLAPCGGLDRGTGADIKRIRFVDALRLALRAENGQTVRLGGQISAPKPNIVEKPISSAAATILGLRAKLDTTRPNGNPTAEASTTNPNTTSPDPVKLQPQ